jgi:murein L,D-transpeptidase YcbB/YkuD
VNKKLQLLFLSICNFATYAQIPNGLLKESIIENQSINKEVKDFYEKINYRTAWVQNENKPNFLSLKNAISNSNSMGLRETDYQFVLKNEDSVEKSQVKNEGLINRDIEITNTAIRFYSDIAYGNLSPSFGYNGLKQKMNCKNIAALLANHILNNTTQQLVNIISPSLPEIKVIENMIKGYLFTMGEIGFKEYNIASSKGHKDNQTLIYRLKQLGFNEPNDDVITDSTIIIKIKKAQTQFNLKADGKLNNTTVIELNIPLQIRLQQLTLSLNYYKWLICLIQNQPAIVVNIPAANLKVYKKNNAILEMKMIVGKKSTPTPTLTSKVDEVILYPYWHVPYSIATKELLPIIKRNPGYINTGNYQVLNKKGEIVDPYSINWQSFSKKYFPYLIRQSTGCDNALGLLKINFINPFGVYLHDTPSKKLFSLNKRFLSHGCMRMENPMEIGHLILKNNPLAIDTLEQKGCLLNQAPIKVHADEHLPVIVWYNPVGIDSANNLIFYEDVYRKFKWVKTQ